MVKKNKRKNSLHSSDFQLFFKLHRTDISRTRMSPEAIVIAFDIAEDFRPRRFDRLERTAVDGIFINPISPEIEATDWPSKYFLTTCFLNS